MSGYIESYRGHVLASECDLMGHMNIQFYNACLAQAMSRMFYALGLPPEEIRTRQRGFAAVDQKSTYHAELLAGDIIHMQSGVLKTSSKTITFHHQLFNSASDTLAYDCTLTSAYMDLSVRKALPLDNIMRDNIEHLMVQGETA